MKNKKKKPSTVRHLIQAFVFAITNGYIAGFQKGKPYGGENKWLCVPGLNCYSCPGALYACPIGSLQAVLNSSSFKISCYVFGFIMVVGALVGRLVCGFLCPFGLVQDLLYKIPFPKKKKNMPGHKYLKYLRYVVLILFVFLLSGLVVNEAGTGKPWYCEYICPSGTLFAGIPLVAMNESLQAIVGWRFALKVSILVVVVLLSLKFFRPFCKYVCPLGAMYGVCNPISVYRFRVNEDKCVSCGACQRACGMDIRVWENPNSTECIRCGECKAACPTGAITTSFSDLRKKLIREEPESITEETPKKRKRAVLINPEEKSNGFNVALGVVLSIVGVVAAIANIGPCASFAFNIFSPEPIEGDFLNHVAMWGNPFIAFLCAVPIVKAGSLILDNKGRRTATTRAVRLLCFAILLNIVVLLLLEIKTNPIVAVVALPLMWILPIVALVLILSCRHMKKAEDVKTE